MPGRINPQQIEPNLEWRGVASELQGAARRRLFLLATALVKRGMDPKSAYNTALYYIDGPGRGRTWVRALAECEAEISRQKQGQLKRPQYPTQQTVGRR